MVKILNIPIKSASKDNWAGQFIVAVLQIISDHIFCVITWTITRRFHLRKKTIEKVMRKTCLVSEALYIKSLGFLSHESKMLNRINS